MKKIIGTLIILLSLSFIGIVILKIWGISIVSINELLMSVYTLLLLGALIVILILVYGLFFRNNSKNYIKHVGNKAHPKS